MHKLHAILLRRSFIRSTTLISLVAGAVACSPDQPLRAPTASAARSSELSANSVTFAEPQYFEPGKSFPYPRTLTAIPRPYDPSRDVVIPNTRPEANLALTRTRPHIPKRDISARGRGPFRSGPPASPNPDHTYNGFWFYQNTNMWYGAYALQDARTDFTLPWYNTYPSVEPTLYAPTMQAPGGSCIEMTMIHTAQSTAITSHFAGFADWCNGAMIGSPYNYYEDITTTAFRQNYVATYNGQPTVTVWVSTPSTGNTNGQCWAAGFYNYRLGGYEQKYSSCGYTQTGFGTTGWTMWEDYSLFYNNDCPSIPAIRSEIIELFHPGFGYAVQFTSYPSDYSRNNGTFLGDCFTTTYSFQSPAANTLPNSWAVIP